ncbi:hypothetical protein E2C01_015685 [Portunus trituberculatus]|uniref:Uncharacterized protein n=1 Tax=Portunus trituberculatus TaxID=210409 RepID=A0A5B7DNR7_PORTR|nr:hypothetical protein [Portunus trituberculatus]
MNYNKPGHCGAGRTCLNCEPQHTAHMVPEGGPSTTLDCFVPRAGAHSGRVCYPGIVDLNAQSLQLWLPVSSLFAHHRALGSSVHCTGESSSCMKNRSECINGAMLGAGVHIQHDQMKESDSGQFLTCMTFLLVVLCGCLLVPHHVGGEQLSSDSLSKKPRARCKSVVLVKDSAPKKATCHCQCNLLEDSNSSSNEHHPKG